MANWPLCIFVLTYSILGATAFPCNNSTNATETSATSSFTLSTSLNKFNLNNPPFAELGPLHPSNNSVVATTIDFSELQPPPFASSDPSSLHTEEVYTSTETLSPSPSAGSSSSSTSPETQDLVDDDDADTSISSVVTPAIYEGWERFNAPGLNSTRSLKRPWDSGNSGNSLGSGWRSRSRSRWNRIERESVENLKDSPIRGCGWAGLGLFVPPLLGLFKHQTREKKRRKRNDSPWRSKNTTSPGPLLKSSIQCSPAIEFESQRLDIRHSECPTANAKTQTQILDSEARPLSQEELTAKVKAIYASLVVVEKKCIDADRKIATGSQNGNDGNRQFLDDEQWQALFSLHRTLLDEHYDFFAASQHPLASTALKRLASKYAMPARMWRHGIHSFLELLRYHLPYSREHLLAFIYLAYGLMALLSETVPASEDTWTECLGDLARYRMAIEDDDVGDRMIWNGVARRWYTKASDKVPATGRLNHHLAILARPNQLEQLFYYVKSLSTNDPFQLSRESILRVLEPALTTQIDEKNSSIVDTYMRLQAILFTKGSITAFQDTLVAFIDVLDNNVGTRSHEFLQEGYYIAIANCVALLDYGSGKGVLSTILSPENMAGARGLRNNKSNRRERNACMFDEAQNLFVGTAICLFERIGDSNILSFVHVTLVFLKYLTAYPAAMELLQTTFPWENLVHTLNSELRRHDVIESDRMPAFHEYGPLPEDFAMRGLYWTDDYFPENWFSNHGFSNENDEVKEVPRNRESRSERILWLAHQLAEYKKWICFDKMNHQFLLPRQRSAWGASPEVSVIADKESAVRASEVDMTDVSSTWRLGSLQTEQFGFPTTPCNEIDIFDQFINPFASPPTTPSPTSDLWRLTEDHEGLDTWSINGDKRDLMELHAHQGQAYDNHIANCDGSSILGHVQQASCIEALVPLSEDSATQELNSGLMQSQLMSNSTTEFKIFDTMEDLEYRELCPTELPFNCAQFSNSINTPTPGFVPSSTESPLSTPTSNALPPEINPLGFSHMYCSMAEVSSFHTSEKFPQVDFKLLVKQPACPSFPSPLKANQTSLENCTDQGAAPSTSAALQAPVRLNNIQFQDDSHEILQPDYQTVLPTVTSPNLTSPNDPEDATFTCPYCYKHFPRKCDLKKHIPSHTRPYQCSAASCTQAFATQKDLDRHISDRHGNNQQSFICRHPDCIGKGRAFKRKDNRNKHWRRAHGRNPRIGEE